jgi:hypothetical protein
MQGNILHTLLCSEPHFHGMCSERTRYRLDDGGIRGLLRLAIHRSQVCRFDRGMLMVVPMISTAGPIARYKQLVEMGRLREDSHQKGNRSISVAAGG